MHQKLMWMEVNIYSVKAKSQTAERKSGKDLRDLS